MRVSVQPKGGYGLAPWSRPAHSQVVRGGLNGLPGYTVRTERWRYTEWDGGAAGQELYDQQVDPQELQNLAAQPQQVGTVKELQALVHAMHPVKVAGGKAAKPHVEGRRK